MEGFIGLNLLSVIFAYCLDIKFGEPDIKYHPVRLIGGLIEKLEKIFYQNTSKIYGGTMLLVSSVFFVFIITSILLDTSEYLGGFIYFIVNSLIIYFSISIKSMTDHAAAVYDPLTEGDIHTARQKLSMIVSRDTEGMDESSIVRSAVESVSENFTDGVVSPVFYSILFGSIGAAVFKTVSTLDSMVGYKNDKYELFGRASAKADDVLNFIPARISVVMVAVAGFFRGVSFADTFETVRKFRLAHPSPNSAHSMSAFAAVLKVTLGGPVSYFGKLKQKPFIGDGVRGLSSEVIKESVSLYKSSSIVTLIIFACIPLLWIIL